MSKSTADSAISNNIGVLAFYDFVESDTIAKFEQYAAYGNPASLVKVASQVSSSGYTAKDYPYDGVTPTISAKSTQSVFNVAADYLPTDGLAGMLIQMTSGSAVGETRRITSQSGAQVTVGGGRATPGFTSTITNGDSYRLYIDVFRTSQLLLKAEYSTSTMTCDVIGIFADYARNAIDAAFRRSIRFFSTQRTIENTGVQSDDSEETSYYHGVAIPIEVRGALGAKVRLVSFTGAGSVSLWACGI